jgi:hypothetical protein
MTMCELVAILALALGLTMAVVLGLESRGRDSGEG